MREPARQRAVMIRRLIARLKAFSRSLDQMYRVLDEHQGVER